MELPGYKKENVRAELKDGYLTVTAAADKSASEGKLVHQERYTGSCKRTFYVGDALRQEDIHASFDSGLLRLRVPKEAPKVEETPKYINIL